jgi:hypothetical protein
VRRLTDLLAGVADEKVPVAGDEDVSNAAAGCGRRLCHALERERAERWVPGWTDGTGSGRPPRRFI